MKKYYKCENILQIRKNTTNTKKNKIGIPNKENKSKLVVKSYPRILFQRIAMAICNHRTQGQGKGHMFQKNLKRLIYM